MPNPIHEICYLSLEIGLWPEVPTYSGGLGLLAGDTIMAAADLGLPMVACTLLYRDGYFTQTLGPDGGQVEGPTKWNPESLLEELPQRAFVPIEGRTVLVRAFRAWVRGATGWSVPVYFLDSDLPENTEADRKITRALYSGDPRHRVRQAAVLGIAGKRIVRAMTHDCTTFHMNEGHAFLVMLELMSEWLARHRTPVITPAAIEHVRSHCVFTTHTPVPAGHDRFDPKMVAEVVGGHPVLERPDLIGSKTELNTTIMALNLSRFANAVAKRHAEVSREMFPGYAIAGITNGVHAGRWASPHIAPLFDQHLPGWRADHAELRNAWRIPAELVRDAHADAKRAMLTRVQEATGQHLREDVFTIGFARRSTAYKRPDLILTDPKRLAAIAEKFGGLQIVFAGKAHPHDGPGKEYLKRIAAAAKALHGAVEVAVVPNYDIALASRMVAGVDLWLNNPRPPLEASGTSGMKAAVNGVPSLSTLDGWWIEGCVEGLTGWSIEGSGSSEAETDALHAESLYAKLEGAILPTWRGDTEAWVQVQRACIAINGSHFSTQRMVREYVAEAYLH